MMLILILFQGQLDKCIVEIRDACCDSSIDQVARLHLLEVVELRGNKWHQNENIAAYYRERLAKLKVKSQINKQKNAYRQVCILLMRPCVGLSLLNYLFDS